MAAKISSFLGISTFNVFLCHAFILILLFIIFNFCLPMWQIKGVQQWRPQTMTMTVTNHDDQLGEIYPTMLNELNRTFGVKVFHVFVAVAVMVMVCGRHGIKIYKTHCANWPPSWPLVSTAASSGRSTSRRASGLLWFPPSLWLQPPPVLTSLSDEKPGRSSWLIMRSSLSVSERLLLSPLLLMLLVCALLDWSRPDTSHSDPSPNTCSHYHWH